MDSDTNHKVIRMDSSSPKDMTIQSIHCEAYERLSNRRVHNHRSFTHHNSSNWHHSPAHSKHIERQVLHTQPQIFNHHTQLQNCIGLITPSDISYTCTSGIRQYNTKTMTSHRFIDDKGAFLSLTSTRTITAGSKMTGDLCVFDNSTRQLVWMPIDRKKGQLDMQVGALRIYNEKMWTGGNSRKLLVFDLEKQSIADKIEVGVEVNYFARDRGVIAAACDSCEVVLVDERSGKRITSLEEHLDYCCAVDLKLGEDLIATGSQDMSARVWDLRNTSRSLNVVHTKKGVANKVAFYGRNRLVIGEPYDHLHSYDYLHDTIDTYSMICTMVGIEILNLHSDRFDIYWGFHTNSQTDTISYGLSILSTSSSSSPL